MRRPSYIGSPSKIPSCRRPMLFVPPDRSLSTAELQQLSDAPGFDLAVVGAHPDDTEVACGGTMAALAAAGYRVAMIDLTDGEPTPGSTSIGQRMEEAQSAAQTLGVAYRRILSLPNRRLFDDFESRVALAAEFRRLRPYMVIGFGSRTPLASPDHHAAMMITDAAVFYSRLSKWGEHFGDLKPHVVSRQMYFRIPLEPVVHTSADAQLTMDISDHLQTKLDAIRCYKSQFDRRPYVIERVQAAAVLHGAAAGYAAGEIFTSPRPLGTPDILRFARGDGSQAAALQSMFIDPAGG